MGEAWIDKSSKQNKAVSFATHVRVKDSLHLNDYSEEERKNCWYNGLDIAMIKKNARSIVEVMESADGLKPEDENFCFRGLECQTRARLEEREQIRRQAYDAVFLEQRRQRQEGVTNIQTISTAYSAWSRFSAITARLSGLSDKRYALRSYPRNIKPKRVAEWHTGPLVDSSKKIRSQMPSPPMSPTTQAESLNMAADFFRTLRFLSIKVG